MKTREEQWEEIGKKSIEPKIIELDKAIQHLTSLEEKNPLNKKEYLAVRDAHSKLDNALLELHEENVRRNYLVDGF